jgi:hypothetical protein
VPFIIDNVVTEALQSPKLARHARAYFPPKETQVYISFLKKIAREESV